MTLFPRRILLVTGGFEEAELATGVAVTLAKSTDSELYVGHVKLLPLYPPPYSEVLGWGEDLERAEREARKVSDEQVKTVEDGGGTVAVVQLSEERPAEEIVPLAEELEAYLIVGESRGHGGIRRAPTVSVSDRVVRRLSSSGGEIAEKPRRPRTVAWAIAGPFWGVQEGEHPALRQKRRTLQGVKK